MVRAFASVGVAVRRDPTVRNTVLRKRVIRAAPQAEQKTKFAAKIIPTNKTSFIR